MNLKYVIAIISLAICLTYLHQARKRSQPGPSAAIVVRADNNVQEGSAVATHEPPSASVTGGSKASLPAQAKTKLQKRLEAEAAHLYDLSADPALTKKRLRAVASQLTAENLQELAELASISSYGYDLRLTSIYVLTLVGTRAQDSLLKFFLAPLPAVHDHQQDYNLKTVALEAIEANMHASKTPLSAPAYLDDVYLNNLLRLVRAGEKSHRPMLKDFIDQNLQAASL